jgi:putative transposase
LPLSIAWQGMFTCPRREDHRADYGVEPICRVLPIAPATFYDHLAKRADPSRLSDRAVRDAELKPEIERVFEDNLSVYGVRKVWHQMRREGFDIARCTVARLPFGTLPCNALSGSG